MQLLTSEEIKTKTDAIATQQKERVMKMNREENESAERLNTARMKEEKETAEIRERMSEMERTATEREYELVKLIDSLEARKREAEKPIQISMKEAEEKHEENRREKAEMEEERERIGERAEELREKMEHMSDMDEELEERRKKVEMREAKNDEVEKKMKEQAETLSEKWAQYHGAVHVWNEETRTQKGLIEAGRKANEEVKRMNEEEKMRLTQERRAIHDGYLALEQAKKHING